MHLGGGLVQPHSVTVSGSLSPLRTGLTARGANRFADRGSRTADTPRPHPGTVNSESEQASAPITPASREAEVPAQAKRGQPGDGGIRGRRRNHGVWAHAPSGFGA